MQHVGVVVQVARVRAEEGVASADEPRRQVVAREIDPRVHRDDDDVGLAARRAGRARPVSGKPSAGRVVDQLAPDRRDRASGSDVALDTGSRHVPFCVMSGADRATSRESDVMPPSIADLLATGEPLVLPGVYDALSARLAAEAGFRAVFLSGFAMAATRLGRPDIGLLTQTEVLDAARLVCAATPCPVIVDIDTGYGDPLNVERTRDGAAAPGRRRLLPRRPGVAEALRPHGGQAHRRRSTSTCPSCAPRCARASGAAFHVTARTDARAVAGLDEAIASRPRVRGGGRRLRCSSRRRSPWTRWTQVRAAVPAQRAAGRQHGRAGEDAATHRRASSVRPAIALIVVPVAGLLASAHALRALYARCSRTATRAP